MAEIEQQASSNLLQDLAPTGALLGSFIAVVAATVRLNTSQDLGTLQALLVALGGVISAVIVFVRGILHILRNPPASRQSERDRLLSAVDRAWVKGVLNRTINGLNPCEIDLTLEPDAVQTYRVVRVGATPITSKEIANLFKDMHQRVLILGEEGSGKTMLMLQLLQRLMVQAQEKPNAPFPVVLSLAGWRRGFWTRLWAWLMRRQDQQFQDWLAGQVCHYHRVSRASADQWVRAGKLILLLDELDVLPLKERQACVEDIYVYLQRHTAQMVISCCTAAYDELNPDKKLNLDGAIVLQPLTEARITTFLQQEKLTGLNALYQRDPHIRKWSQNLSLLNLMAQAYYDQSDAALGLMEGKERLDDLINAYIQTMVQYEEQPTFDLVQTENYLRWLAAWIHKFGKANDESGFDYEDLRPKRVLSTRKQRARYLLGIIGFHALITPVIGVFAGWGSVVVFLVPSVLIDLIGFFRASRIHVVDSQLWSQRFLWIGSIAAVLGTAVGLFVLSSGNLVLGLLIFSAIFFLTGLLFILGLVDPMAQTDIERTIPGKPNQAIWRSPQIAPIIGLAFTSLLTLAAAFTPREQLADLSPVQYFQTIIGTVLIGTLLLSPGAIYLRWYVIMRAASGHVDYQSPTWRNLTFLDYAARLQLLRQRGERYRFRHPLLEAHFAPKDIPTSEDQPLISENLN